MVWIVRHDASDREISDAAKGLVDAATEIAPHVGKTGRVRDLTRMLCMFLALKAGNVIRATAGRSSSKGRE